MVEEIKNNIVKLNQHFLNDGVMLEQIVSLSGIDPDETILEIGPGRGNLTSRVATRAKKVISVESDTRLREDLLRVQSQNPNVSLVYGNALDIRLPKFDKLIANIPFNITEPLIMKLIGEKFNAAILLVGESFAYNCCSTDGHNTRLGLLTRAYFQPEYLLQVPRDCFTPAPSTDGAVIGLYPIKKSYLQHDFALYVIRCMWDQRTRPVRDALAAALSQYVMQRGSNQVDLSRATKMLEENYAELLGKRVEGLWSVEFRGLYDSLSTIKLKRLFEGHKPRGGAQNWRKTYQMYLR